MFNVKILKIEGNLLKIEGNIASIPGDIGNINGNIRNIPGNIRNLNGNILIIPGNTGNIPGNIGNIPFNIANIPALQALRKVSTMGYFYRKLTSADEPLLWRMLMIAAHETDLEVVQSHPDLARYVADWGQPHDRGFVAIEVETQQPVGAVWLRLWTGTGRGFGYVDERTPELAMAVLPEHRNRGIGTQLLKSILQDCQDDYPALSLNVRAENPVVRLYERMGFRKMQGSEIVNRTGGVSFNMIALLRDA